MKFSLVYKYALAIRHKTNPTVHSINSDKLSSAIRYLDKHHAQNETLRHILYYSSRKTILPAQLCASVKP